MVELNEPVPVFSLPVSVGELAVSTGELFTLSEHRGKWVVVYFYPRDDTPGCTKEACDFRDQHPDFSACNCVVVGISTDDAASHQRFQQKFSLNFGLLIDAEEQVCTLFDVIQHKNMYGKSVRGIQRSTFLIDPDGVLRAQWRSVKVDGHVVDVLNTLKRLSA